MWYIYINTLINLEHLKNYINLLFRRQYDIRKKSGFSLAEALITLLIVCLITLATVPVLTKKKRDTRNVSGMWMCSRKADGTYVYWSNIENSGDITNPETWQPTNTDSCTFVPSINAKNFVVTIIGGGGGGADGESSRKDYITNEQTSFTPAEDDEYNLLVVGGGGGGAGGQEQSGVSGGAGGAGGYYLGKVKLYANRLYSGVIGGGGNSICSQWKEHSKTADTGGTSYFKIGDTNAVTAAGGYGGQNRNCSNMRCWGGSAGGGGAVGTSSEFRAVNEKQVIFAGSGAGASGGHPGTGTTLTKEVSGLGADYTYGTGGYGATRNKCGGTSGQSGTVRLWQIIKNGGLGGQAAKPLVLPLPSLRNNKLKAYIGEGGTNGNAGTQSSIQILDRTNKVIQQYSAQGGNAGTKNTTLDATAGENSLWNNRGGGAIGECRPAQNANYTYKPVEKERPVYDTNGNPVCEFQLTDAEGYFTSIVHPSYSYLHRCNNSQEVCIGYHITYSGGLISKNPIDYTNYINCTDKMAMLNKDTASIDDYRRVLEPCKTPSIYYKDYPKGMIVNNTTNNTTCLKEKTEKYTTQELVMTSPAKPAECDDSYNGVSFGAGGGGGAASDTLGVFGKGGKGAYGAVIVEW